MKLDANRTVTAIRQLATGFSRDTGGAVALLAGLAAVPMFLAAGAAVDFYRVDAARAEVQASLDAGALAGAAAKPGTSEAERRKIALDTFQANLKEGFADKLEGAPQVSFDDDSLTVSYDGGLPATLLRIGGFNKFNVGASSTVRMNLPARAEIALVLDYSSSMEKYSAGQQKYITMRKAAIDMVNGLTNNGKNADVMFGLVPFSHNVYATLPAGYVVGAGGSSWTGCTYDRQYPHNTTAATPGGSNKSKWGQAKPTKWAWPL